MCDSIVGHENMLITWPSRNKLIGGEGLPVETASERGWDPYMGEELHRSMGVFWVPP